MARTIKKIVFLIGHGRHGAFRTTVDIYMAGGATGAPATNGLNILNTVVANDLHDGRSRLPLDRCDDSGTRGDDDFWHGSPQVGVWLKREAYLLPFGCTFQL